MKLRLKGNSIRLRLQRSEVARLQDEKVVSDATEFPGGPPLCYAIHVDPAVASVAIRYASERIELRVPVARATAWFAADEVTLAETLTLENGEKLLVVVEKDFKCLHAATMDDESDAFENPSAKSNH